MLHKYKRRSKGPTLGLTGPDMVLKPFGALVHIDWLEMKNGSKARRRRAVSVVPVEVPGLRTSAQARR